MNNKGIIFALFIVLVGLAFITFTNTDESASTEEASETATSTDVLTEDGNEPRITPISHASFVLEWGGVTIYNDPVGEAAQYDTPPELILLSDIHSDHLNITTLEAVVSAADSVQIIAPQAVYEELSLPLQELTVVLSNGESFTFGGFEIEGTPEMADGEMFAEEINITAVPMYNLPREGEDYRHVKGRGNGYVLEHADTRVYIAGDTDATPELKALTDIDIAFVPMNPPYTMGVEEAAAGVLAFAPGVVYPYHYRTFDGLSDVARFRQLVSQGNPDIEVRLLDWYPETEEADEAVDSEEAR